MPHPNTVSLWLGTFSDEETFFAYIERAFDDAGSATSTFELDHAGRFEEDYREAEFFPDGVHDLAAALSLFSHGEEFAGEAAERAHALDIDPALINSVVLLYGLAYRPPRNFMVVSPLRFVGVFHTE